MRLVDGQILDEFRVTDGKGETLHMTTTIRAYNALIDRWEVIGMNGSRGMPDVGTAWRVGEEVHLEQKFGVMSPNPSILRVRYYNIQADRFSWKADRSTDGGKTWVKDHLTIEARRIGPPRSQGPLAVARAR